jgi:hypothetical protein
MDRVHPNEQGNQQQFSRHQKPHICIRPGLPYRKKADGQQTDRESEKGAKRTSADVPRSAEGHGLPSRLRWRNSRCTPDSCRLAAAPNFGSPGPHSDIWQLLFDHHIGTRKKGFGIR